MPTFWDLPKNVRDIIYRHHLVYDKPVTIEMYQEAIAYTTDWCWRKRCMPPIFHLSKKAEREAIPFYYEMNVFDIGSLGTASFTCMTFPRHWNRVRKVICEWIPWDFGGGWGQYGEVRKAFISLGKMKKLEDLSIQVNESKMVERMCVKREIRQRPWSQNIAIELTSQQNLAILRCPGVTGLLTLTKIKHVNFVKLVNPDGTETGGMVPGGAIMTHILPRLRPKLKPKRQKKGSSFRFLDLLPELRNRVYDLLLRIAGPIHPSKEPPTSAPKDPKTLKTTDIENAASALCILSVCKQMYGEAVGIYYHHNSFLFHYPVQLNVFLTAIGERAKMIRDITIYYHNTKLGGVELIDLTFALLKQLTGLKRLHVIMMAGPRDVGHRRGWYQPHSGMSSSMRAHGANPARIPGMRQLFDLRGLTDVKVRDLQLEKKFKELQADKAFPNFPKGGENARAARMVAAYDHFNAALADAQLGNVNERLLEDKQWQWWDVFPTMESDGVVRI